VGRRHGPVHRGGDRLRLAWGVATANPAGALNGSGPNGAWLMSELRSGVFRYSLTSTTITSIDWRAPYIATRFPPASGYFVWETDQTLSISLTRGGSQLLVPMDRCFVRWCPVTQSETWA
jgi:hypothetical protein